MILGANCQKLRRNGKSRYPLQYQATQNYLAKHIGIFIIIGAILNGHNLDELLIWTYITYMVGKSKLKIQTIQNRPDRIAGPCVTMKDKPFSPKK